MMRRITSLAICLLAFSTTSPAQEEPSGPCAPGVVCVEGRASGTNVGIFGTEVFAASDTGTNHADAPGTFDVTAPAETSPLVIPGAVIVVNDGASTTSGEAVSGTLANPLAVCDSNVQSAAGIEPGATVCDGTSDFNSVVDLIPGDPPRLRAVTTCSQMSGDGNTGLTGQSFVSLVEISGNPIEIGDSDTTILTEDLPLLRLNHQVTSTSTSLDGLVSTLSLQQRALQAQAVTDDGEVVQVILSHASGTLQDLDSRCGAFHCPILDVLSTIQVNVDQLCKGSPDPGDEITMAVKVTNSSKTGAATDLQIVDRIPGNIELIAGSATVEGLGATDPPATITTGPCGDIEFKGCPGDDNPEPQCLTAEIGDLAPGASRTLKFRAKVFEDGGVCNTALASVIPADLLCPLDEVVKEATAIRPQVKGCDKTPIEPNPDTLKTFGSGGCSVAPAGSSASLDFWPVLLLGGLFAIRQGLRRRSKSA